MNKNVIAIIVALCILIGGIIYFSLSTKQVKQNVEVIQNVSPTAQQTQTLMTLEKPTLLIDSKKTYSAILKTSQGDITIELDSTKTPTTVNNFVYLARKHFYDNTIFHRVITGFMIQGGDPEGTGAGGPGYTFDDEQFIGEYSRGTIAMANAGPNTNGSQFFIMHKDYDLSKNYVIFGHVTKGIEVVDAIAGGPVTVKNGENSSPVNPVVVTSVEITEE